MRSPSARGQKKKKPNSSDVTLGSVTSDWPRISLILYAIEIMFQVIIEHGY